MISEMPFENVIFIVMVYPFLLLVYVLLLDIFCNFIVLCMILLTLKHVNNCLVSSKPKFSDFA